MVTPNPENPYIKTLQKELARAEHVRKTIHRAWIINLTIGMVLMITVVGIPYYYILFGGYSTTTNVALLLLQIVGAVSGLWWFDGVKRRYYELITNADVRLVYIREAMSLVQKEYDKEFRKLL